MTLESATSNSLSERPWYVYRRLMGLVLIHRHRLALAMLALGLASLSTLAIPWLASEVFQEAALQRDMSGVQRTLSLVLFVAAVMALSRFVAEDQIGYIALTTVEKLRIALASKLLRLPLSYHARTRTGESVSRTSSDVSLLQNFTYDSLFSMGGDVLQVIGSVGCLVYLNWRLTLVLAAIVPVGALIVGMTSKWVRRRMVALQARHADMTGLLTEQLFAAPAVHAFDAADYERSRFAAVASGYTRAGRATLRVGAGTRGFVNFLSIVAIVFVLICGLQGVDLDKKGDLNALVKFALFVALLGEPLTRISRTVFEIQRALAAGARIFEIIDSPIDAQDGRQVFPDSAQGAVRFENVSFSYHPDEPILRAISLELQPRENVAIVGASGCGKSTLAGLILRFIDPTQGKVTIDGVNSRDVKLADLRARVGWMGQEAFLVSGTVYDNIRYGKRSANPTELEQAARMVAADEFIRELPLGYESRLGERGVNLSGGQRARIAMARAVVRNPAIAIFDESTAALDTDTEMLLWRRLRPWMTERTTIIIAHRLLTILEVPRIIVLDGGKIVGDGSAQQLQKTCPTFQRLFAEQMNLMSQAA